MNKIKDIITYLQNLETEQILNVIIALAILIMFLVMSSMISYAILRIFYKKENKEEIKKTHLYKHIRLFINLTGLYISTKLLTLPTEQTAFCDKCYRIVIIWTIANIISGTIELRELIIDKIRNKKKDITDKDKYTVRVISKIIKVILYITAAYLTLKEFDYDLGGLATGLGIGGAIVALAAQDIVKQLLAGFAIMSDKTFEIGDWIEVGETSGTVVTITWRSTKIETMEGTMVTIDNSVILKNNIVNWGKISKRAFKTNLKLALETDEAIVEKVTNRIRFILKYNNDIIKDTIRVQFLSIQEDALNISIYVETTVTNYDEYLNFCNKLNLTLLNILESQGVKLAYPGKNIYIKEEQNINNKRIINNNDKNNLKKTKPIKIEK